MSDTYKGAAGAGSVSRPFTPADAAALYHVPAWGAGYFSVTEKGRVGVRPLWNDDLEIDLYRVVRRVIEKGGQLPVLLRFQDLLQARVIRLNQSFATAVARCGYRSPYRGVFPIKVNQLREVVEEILEAGEPYGYGLECGSKAELVAALPYMRSDEALLVCNGSKDGEMMRLILAAQEIGKNVVPVIERYEEFERFRGLAEGKAARLGVRVRLSTEGAGLWSESGGEDSKFGLSLDELLRMVDVLKAGSGLELRLLHFHLGSQIADLANVRGAVQEGARLYVELRRMGMPIGYIDIGGGLGVAYEAGNPDVAGTINYSMDEYTDAVVSSLFEVCEAEGVPHPMIVSESGRAVTAFHSVLVIEALDSRKKADSSQASDFGEHPLHGALTAAGENPAEMERLKEEALNQFRAGRMSLRQKAAFDLRYRDLADHLLGGTPDQYLVNFSVFRSLIDYLLIDQRFPIMPIHRLDEAPTERGTLVDLTCDSDGHIADFVSPVGNKQELELHPLESGEPYYIGLFLMGAYQDVMGDQHNLFGRVTEAHIYADAEEAGNFYIEKIIPGATIQEQLAQVQYFPNDLERRMNKLIQEKVKAGQVRPRAGVALLEEYKRLFESYTYLKPE